jgi:hypothetical protein
VIQKWQGRVQKTSPVFITNGTVTDALAVLDDYDLRSLKK